VLPLTDDIIVQAAELYALLYQAGQLISDTDILIAATALKHNLVMVTENVSHFRRIPGLALESWRVCGWGQQRFLRGLSIRSSRQRETKGLGRSKADTFFADDKG
jgi:hypothetical protein